MGKRFKGFSQEEHEDVAKRIKGIEMELMGICNRIFNKYGVSSVQGKVIERMVVTPGILFKLKSALNSNYEEENKDGEKRCGPYY